MKLIDGIKLRGNPAEILDCSRDDLPQFFVEMGYKAGAEIGVYKGQFSKKFCQVGLNFMLSTLIGFIPAIRIHKAKKVECSVSAR